jgi:hypothetical protein
MITLTTAAWITLTLVSLVSVLLMRGTVRAFGQGADNGWDNAIGYVVVTGLLYFGIAWLAQTSFLLAALAPLFAWIGQTLTIRFIYEVRTARAWLLGIFHAFATTVVVGAMGLAVAFVAAYVLYGKIISDPMYLLRLLLRLIGIDLPF